MVDKFWDDQPLRKILMSKKSQLIDVALEAGLDPKTLYRYADFRGVDLSGQKMDLIDVKCAIFEDADVEGGKDKEESGCDLYLFIIGTGSKKDNDVTYPYKKLSNQYSNVYIFELIGYSHLQIINVLYNVRTLISSSINRKELLLVYNGTIDLHEDGLVMAMPYGDGKSKDDLVPFFTVWNPYYNMFNDCETNLVAIVDVTQSVSELSILQNLSELNWQLGGILKSLKDNMYLTIIAIRENRYTSVQYSQEVVSHITFASTLSYSISSNSAFALIVSRLREMAGNSALIMDYKVNSNGINIIKN